MQWLNYGSRISATRPGPPPAVGAPRSLLCSAIASNSWGSHKTDREPRVSLVMVCGSSQDFIDSNEPFISTIFYLSEKTLVIFIIRINYIYFN